ncbi:calcium-binding protein [Paracoccus sp. (in: a-proteobacteria)]|uniref:calcium-binding protein n=1 Tax=Paracoccus sp. TaxID=267 RepID=UPI002AFFC1EF|nr:calcium-binding protein [Paracoccus sp. (in: a-proteobacteria)]
MVSYEGSNTGVTINLEDASGSTTVQSAKGGHATGDILSGIEQVMGSDHSDVLAGSSLDNVLIGGKGNDRVSGLAGNDDLAGGDGNDTLNGGTGADRIWGDKGDDVITASSGRDTIYGGAGRDTYSFASSAASVSIDLITNKHTGFAAETEIFEVENITAGSGNDTLRGTAKANTLDGGAGNDLFIATGAGDVLIGGAGTDTVSYQSVSAGILVDFLNSANNTGVAAGDTYSGIEDLWGSAHSDTLRGNDIGNRIRGGDGNDHLEGRGGVDLLYGEVGNNTLGGGAGADNMNGGAGNDVYWIDDKNDIIIEAANGGTDRINSTIPISLMLGTGPVRSTSSSTPRNPSRTFAAW